MDRLSRDARVGTGRKREMLMSIRTRVAGAVVAGAGVAAALVVWSAPSGAATPRAVAELRSASDEVLGTVTFLGHGSHATSVRVELALPAGAPGLGDFHGLHVHAVGTCDPAANPVFGSAGGHWDTGGHTHGAHLGDLPSVLVGSDGTASLTTATPRFEVGDLAGHAVILHAGRDNFGNVPVGAAADQYTANGAAASTATANTGNAGARYGCGVIELAGN